MPNECYVSTEQREQEQRLLREFTDSQKSTQATKQALAEAEAALQRATDAFKGAYTDENVARGALSEFYKNL